MKVANKIKQRFLFNNILKGSLGLIFIVGLIVLINKLDMNDQIELWLYPIYNRSLLMYSVYAFSEIFFGIIPPEFFMLWGAHFGSLSIYIKTIVILSAISYLAGLLGYSIGRFFTSKVSFRYIRIRFFSKYHTFLMKYSGLLLIMAALTPLPFSAICMLIGSIKYPFPKFLLFAGFRFIRFVVYSVIMWQTYNM